MLVAMISTLRHALRPSRVRLDDGALLPVRIFGRGEPVLMLPGLGMASSAWLPFALPLASRHRFYLPDFRGQGDAQDVPFRGDDVFESHADDVASLVDALGLEDFRLVGYSLGATTSLHLMRRGTFFERARAYLHIDQSPFVGSDATWTHGLVGTGQPALVERMRRALELLDAHPDAARVSELPPPARAELGANLEAIQVALGVPPPRARLGRHLVARAPETLLRQGFIFALPTLRAYLRGYGAGGHDYREAIAQAHTPVTVFAGMRSELYSFEGQRLVADLAANGEVVRFERSGHLLAVQEPLRFGRELGRFLAAR